MSLKELRGYANRTQMAVAEGAAMTQPELSRLERRDDFLLSTLRRYVEALGGTVDLVITLGSSSFRLVDAERVEAEPTTAQVQAAIEGLASLKEWLPPLVSGLNAAQLRERIEGCGTFSLSEHVWHLHDLELEAYRVRLHRMRTEHVPVLDDFDGDSAAADRAYQARPVAPAVEGLLASRQSHVSSMKKLDPAALRKLGDLEGVGRISIARLLVRWYGHDLGHRIEMERLREELMHRGARAPARGA